MFKKYASSLPVLVLVLVTAIAFGSAGFYLGSNREQLSKTNNNVAMVTPSPTATANPTALSAKLTSIDGTWNKYTNTKYGYSMKIPKAIDSTIDCPKAENGKYFAGDSVNGNLPVTVFGTGSAAYIAPVTYVDYAQLTPADNNQYNYYGSCERNDTTPAAIESKDYPEAHWKIVAATVRTDADLEAFLKKEYGKGCSLGEKKPDSQSGGYDIEIKTDGKELGDSDCPINYVTKVKYNPTTSVVVKWDMGQGAVFYGPNEKIYDGDMTDSFKFE